MSKPEFPDETPDGGEFFDQYESVFSYRYGSQEMRHIWSENHKWELASQLWTAVARAQNRAGLVTDEQLADLEAHIGQIDFVRVMEIEKDTKHDIVAAIQAYAEEAQIGGPIIHLGMTSEDMTSNVDMIRTLESVDLIQEKLDKALQSFAGRIEEFADTPTMGWTHMQPAEPTTVGYRLARYAQNFLNDRQMLEFVRENVRAKGIKGAVGTSASFDELLKDQVVEEGEDPITPRDLEAMVMEELGLEPALVTGQVAPRKHDAWVANALAGIGDSAVEFGLNFRILQSPPFGEWSEKRGSKQVGSSAMPWKKNPINSENMASLGAGILGDVVNAHNVAARQVLERGIDDSADRRITTPDMFLRADEVLKRVNRVVSGMEVNDVACERNLRNYGLFSAIEKVIIAAVEANGDRQEAHEVLREISLTAFAEVEKGEPNPLVDMVCSSDYLLGLGMQPDELAVLFDDIASHVGDAPERARELVEEIRAL